MKNSKAALNLILGGTVAICCSSAFAANKLGGNLAAAIHMAQDAGLVVPQTESFPPTPKFVAQPVASINDPFDEFIHQLEPEDRPQAEETLTNTIEADPQSWQAYRERAIIRLVHKNYVGATQDANSALGITRRDILMLDVLSVSLTELGRGEKAIPLMVEAINLNPANVETYTLSSKVWGALGREKERVATLQKILHILRIEIKKHPKYARAYAERAEIWHQLGKRKEELADLATATKLDPKTYRKDYEEALHQQ